MNAVITLTTDFGLADGYVAAMKGVILGINPEARLVDICHNIKPQAINEAAFVLGTTYQFFPEHTIHVVVVDPGVGTERRVIILRTPSADFVAPDNGVLSYVIQQYVGKARLMNNRQQVELEPGSGLEAVAITKSQFWRSSVSSTFHGRDIFAPVAARLSLGLPPPEFGEAIASVTMLPLSCPHQAEDGILVGHILHIDSFGNLITDVSGEYLLKLRQPIIVEVGNQCIQGLSRTYAESSGLLALIGNSGYLEIALNKGNASVFLHAGIGDEVKIREKNRADK